MTSRQNLSAVQRQQKITLGEMRSGNGAGAVSGMSSRDVPDFAGPEVEGRDLPYGQML
jgi:hypothetical protein